MTTEKAHAILDEIFHDNNLPLEIKRLAINHKNVTVTIQSTLIIAFQKLLSTKFKEKTGYNLIFISSKLIIL